MSTSNVYNTGIMHWMVSPGRVACNASRAIMGVTGAEFATEPKPCKRCLAKYNSAVSKAATKVSA